MFDARRIGTMKEFLVARRLPLRERSQRVEELILVA